MSSALYPMASFTRAVSTILLLIGAAASAQTLQREPIVGGPCEGCEGVFEGLPSEIETVARIGTPEEPGEPMTISGVVRDSTGAPVADIIAYAYHTDNRGIYRCLEQSLGSASARHGQLRAWAKNDATGRYRFRTIRPAGYPHTDIPAHVHLHIIEPGRCTYYIDDIHFTDDLRFTATERRRLRNRGGPGIAEPSRDANGSWLVARDISLGQNIPGYSPRSP